MARFRARAPRAGTVDVKRLICAFMLLLNAPVNYSLDRINGCAEGNCKPPNILCSLATEHFQVHMMTVLC